MKNPGVVIPDAMTAIRALNEAIKQGGVTQRTLDLVHLRASQINGCSVCVGAAARVRKDGETEERLFSLVAWRDTPFFTDAERAALALTEAVTRLSDRTDPVPDEIWNASMSPPGKSPASTPAKSAGHCRPVGEYSTEVPQRTRTEVAARGRRTADLRRRGGGVQAGAAPPGVRWAFQL
jgi:AhpD family alkylhydroperoxidase